MIYSLFESGIIRLESKEPFKYYYLARFMNALLFQSIIFSTKNAYAPPPPSSKITTLIV